MKWFTSVGLMLFFSLSSLASTDLEYIRSRYGKAATDEQLCRTLLSQMAKIENSTIHLGYLGAFQTIWAQHAKGPWAKLSTFNKGKKNIEKAVKADPKSVELRFIRLSIQKNCPRFLGYRSAIEEDTSFIKNNMQQIRSETLLKMCLEII